MGRPRTRPYANVHPSYTPIGTYRRHKASAKTRGIEFALTFDQWWGIWQKSGHYKDRPFYHMCRTGDRGGYVLGNIRIDAARNNNLEAGRRRRLKRAFL